MGEYGSFGRGGGNVESCFPIQVIVLSFFLFIFSTKVKFVHVSATKIMTSMCLYVPTVPN